MYIVHPSPFITSISQAILEMMACTHFANHLLNRTCANTLYGVVATAAFNNDLLKYCFIAFAAYNVFLSIYPSARYNAYRIVDAYCANSIQSLTFSLSFFLSSCIEYMCKFSAQIFVYFTSCEEREREKAIEAQAVSTTQHSHINVLHQ